MPVIALTTDTSALTALGNDYGFDRVFARQVEALGGSEDVALGITTSGRSPNVIAALELARARGLVTIALTGRDGGPTGAIADVHLNVPHDSTARIQEAQLTLLHVVCALVEREMSVKEAAAATNADLAIVADIERKLLRAEYKRRQAPPGVKLGARNFGRDRRYPITNAFHTSG